MADEHFSRETLEQFFRSELPREKTRDFVRHLLRRCPRCSWLLREVSRRESFQALIGGLEGTTFHSDPDRGGKTLAVVSRFRARSARASP